MAVTSLAVWLTLALSASSLSIEKRAACTSYTIINTRGTGEAQGPSSAFRTMNSNIQSQVSGGKIYNTVYAAGFDQNSAAATTDIVNKITSTLRTSPSECFLLEGYSQGAAATVNAMSKITGANFDAVKGVYLVGDPNHKSGLSCNVDNNGGTTTRNVNGLSAAASAGIPSTWQAKTLDVCIYGDGVCDTTHGQGINAQHLQYPNDTPTQNMGTTFGVGKLRGTA
ncbi:carbohydrate esterase family 5 protein [Dothidotthia symphoricarpi CBS 119687]|uniref:Carbohydrate esterase family 5 protein n=1 Tax=Dothidotthia symphoricarpi CBS 119687 TaxID=1392245 RepID=A0A6A6AAW6_9PLEO|nr:carbohydrate esterase family 5 protein [Dothidotthia symphoricarpi CBS 119687]KAF2128716.1 carbohydrate esterase family 5 protein [Dothidotthia symphoricarpi CBS 119687]